MGMDLGGDVMSDCWYCGNDLCWDSDFNLDEVTGDPEDVGIATFLHCPVCGAEVQYMLREDGEEDR